MDEKDPVCGMSISTQKAKAKSDFAGRSYYFCCLMCQKRFDENPQKFVRNF